MKKWIASLLAMMMLLCYAAAASAETSEVAPGDIITFGSYEQDNNLNNGPEPIEWIVLEVQDGKAFLLSKYGLDAVPYHNDPWHGATWENCTLRAWLNDDFLNAAFSEEEQLSLLVTEVDNSRDQGCSEWTLDGGNDTQDRVFLLSFAEANRYLGVLYIMYHQPDEESIPTGQVKPTAYALARGVFVNGEHVDKSDRDMAWWWLRSPGHFDGYVSAVNVSGRLSAPGNSAETISVRPAVWISLE